MNESKNTTYNGTLFRSHLEARWAVFFDALSIEFEYEPEVFEITYGPYSMVKGSYIPDFYLKNLETYIEIKPIVPSKEELSKIAAFARKYEPIILLYGTSFVHPSRTKSYYKEGPDKLDNGWKFYWNEKKQIVFYVENIWWGQCPRCGKISLSQFGVPSCELECYNDDEIDTDIDFCTSNIIQAYTKARNYSYQYEKSGITKRFKNKSHIMSEQSPSQAQLDYLKRLGYDGEVESKLHASELISELLEGEEY